LFTPLGVNKIEHFFISRAFLHPVFINKADKILVTVKLPHVCYVKMALELFGNYTRQAKHDSSTGQANLLGIEISWFYQLG